MFIQKFYLIFYRLPFSIMTRVRHDLNFTMPVVLSVLLNNAVSCWDYMFSVIDMWMSMRHWRNDSDRIKPRFSVENLSQCHFVLYRSLMDQPGINPGHAVKGYLLLCTVPGREMEITISRWFWGNYMLELFSVFSFRFSHSISMLE
jgi:hypothetical protein